MATREGEAMLSLLEWRLSLLEWRPSPLEWRPALLGCFWLLRTIPQIFDMAQVRVLRSPGRVDQTVSMVIIEL